MPSHTIARALIALAKLPMAGPSANASGRPSPTTALHVMRDLGGQLDGSTSNEGRIRYILNGGACQVGLESTVIDGITAPDELRILRPGGVSVEQISEALHAEGLSDTVKLRVYGKDMERSSEQESNPTTPGMKYRHYSPTAKVILLQSSSLISASDRQPQAQTFADVIKTQLVFKNSEVVRIGVMSTTDSPLTAWVRQDWKASIPATTNNDTHAHLLSPLTLSSLPNVQIHPFDLGPSDKPDEYARRMFDGLRTLDEGPLHLDGDQCDVIFVEALIDDGVGLAVMNRLKKAASTTIMVNC